MRVTVLGAQGMLGHVVGRVLAEAGHEVRREIARYDPDAPRPFLEAVLKDKPAAVVNCIGVRPGAGVTDNWLRAINVTLPAQVAEAVAGTSFFVQASSDAIFCSTKAARRVDEPGDAIDLYGCTKWEAEQAVRAVGGMVIRTSIIGPELGASRSLMGWFLTQKETVQGFSNQSWNGVTTLEWARICERILVQKGLHSATYQPGIWPALSKAEVLRLIGEVWDSQVIVETVESTTSICRSLVPDMPSPSLREQLLELNSWY